MSRILSDKQYRFKDGDGIIHECHEDDMMVGMACERAAYSSIINWMSLRLAEPDSLVTCLACIGAIP